MSGKYSVSVEDLYSVCVHWQQASGPHPQVLQDFGSADVAVALQLIQRTLK